MRRRRGLLLMRTRRRFARRGAHTGRRREARGRSTTLGFLDLLLALRLPCPSLSSASKQQQRSSFLFFFLSSPTKILLPTSGQTPPSAGRSRRTSWVAAPAACLRPLPPSFLRHAVHLPRTAPSPPSEPLSSLSSPSNQCCNHNYYYLAICAKQPHGSLSAADPPITGIWPRAALFL